VGPVFHGPKIPQLHGEFKPEDEGDMISA
jgi:hypothetical protein